MQWFCSRDVLRSLRCTGNFPGNDQVRKDQMHPGENLSVSLFAPSSVDLSSAKGFREEEPVVKLLEEKNQLQKALEEKNQPERERMFHSH